MTNANPRTDSEASEPAPEGPETTTSQTQPGTGEPTAEQQIERTIEQRYEQLEERYDELRDQLEDYNRSAKQFIRERPGLSIAAALGTGYIIGRLAANRWLK